MLCIDASALEYLIIGIYFVTVLGVGGFAGLADRVRESDLGDAGLHAWEGMRIGGDNPIGADRVATAFGLGFVLSFGYWSELRGGAARAVRQGHVSEELREAERQSPDSRE